MSNIAKRLIASVNMDAVNGEHFERNICSNQMREAAKYIADLQQQIEDMKKYQQFFESCSCHFAEGVEFMTKSEIYEVIKREVKKLEVV